MTWRSSLVLLLAVWAGGCSSTYHLVAQPGLDQELRYERGFPIISSEDVNVVVMRPVQSPIPKKLMFYLAVVNLSEQPFLLSQDLVTATYSGGSVRLWGRDEIIHKLERDAAWASVIVALGSAVQSANTSRTTTTNVTGTYNTYGADGYSSGAFYGTAQTYDAAATEAARAAIRADATAQIETIASNAEAQISSVNEILTLETIDPGEYRGAYLLADIPKGTGAEPNPITFEIRTPTDTHVITFAVYKK